MGQRRKRRRIWTFVRPGRDEVPRPGGCAALFGRPKSQTCFSREQQLAVGALSGRTGESFKKGRFTELADSGDLTELRNTGAEYGHRSG
jgi:hypothetical protein